MYLPIGISRKIAYNHDKPMSNTQKIYLIHIVQMKSLLPGTCPSVYPCFITRTDPKAPCVGTA